MNKHEHVCGKTKISYLGRYQYSDIDWDDTWGGHIYMVTTPRKSIFLEELASWPQDEADIELWTEEQRRQVIPENRLVKCLSSIHTWTHEERYSDHKWGLLAQVARKDLQR